MSAAKHVGADDFDIFPSGNLLDKSNTELLNEIDFILSASISEQDEARAAEEVDRRLELLQARAPVDEKYDDQPTAWKKMIEKYPFMVADDEAPQKSAQRPYSSRRKLVHSMEVAAAVVVLLTVTASAFGFNPLQALFRWAGDVVQVYSNPSGDLELPDSQGVEYGSFREALDTNGATEAQCPTWIPRDYSIEFISVKNSDFAGQYACQFISDRGKFIYRVTTYQKFDAAGAVEQVEDGEKLIEIDGNECVIVWNFDNLKARWNDDNYAYSIAGNLTEEELAEIIKSIK
ncbi:MAG: DUF4367 domain-containing protein [Oscillospiraceae bacterium]